MIAFSAAIAGAVLFLAVCAWVFSAKWGGPSIVRLLPKPGEEHAYVLLHSKKDGLSARSIEIASMATGVFFPLAPGSADVTLAVKLAASGGPVALLLGPQEEGPFSLLGAMELSRADRKAIAEGRVPDRWNASKTSGGTLALEKEGELWKLVSSESPTPLYLKPAGRTLYMALRAEDFRVLESVAQKRVSGFDAKWSVEREFDAHAQVGFGDRTDAPMTLQFAWNGAADTTVHWKVFGLKENASRAFRRMPKALSWATNEAFVPASPLFAMGINMPDLTRKIEEWPRPLGLVASYGASLGLSESDIRRVLTGPLVASIGGQMRFLWVTLPGVMVDFEASGRIRDKLMNAFWGYFLMKAKPDPIPGFESGGATDLPFSLVAASQGDRVLLGVVDAASLQPRQTAGTFLQGELGKFLGAEKNCIGWLFVDAPKLLKALPDASGARSLMNDDENEDENAPEEGDVTERLQRILLPFGKVAILWDQFDAGRFICLQ